MTGSLIWSYSIPHMFYPNQGHVGDLQSPWRLKFHGRVLSHPHLTPRDFNEAYHNRHHEIFYLESPSPVGGWSRDLESGMSCLPLLDKAESC